MSPLHIVYLCHYFPPEPGAPSARGMEMAREWRAEGHRVSVITCFPNHPTGVVPPSYRGRRYLLEDMDGIEVHRVWTYATPNKGFLRKTLGHLVFPVTAIAQGLPRINRPDVVLTSSPTLFSGIAGWFLSRRFRVPFILDVRDLWPAAIVELGMLKHGSLPVRLLEGLEMFLYRQASRVVVVTNSFQETLARRGLPPEKVHVITNGVDPRLYSPQSTDNGFRSELGLSGKFVVQYAGAHGISHALHVLLEVARAVPEAHFLFVGDGAVRDDLIEQAKQMDLGNVTFAPSQTKERMPEVYAAADICLVPLRDVPLFETFIPSKMFEIMACGRPIVASVAGEAAGILQASGAAVVVPPEDAPAIAQAIRALQSDHERRSSLAAAGRSFAVANYDRRQLARRYLAILRSVAGEGIAQ